MTVNAFPTCEVYRQHHNRARRVHRGVVVPLEETRQRPQHVPTRVLGSLETIQSHRSWREMPASLHRDDLEERLITAGLSGNGSRK